MKFFLTASFLMVFHLSCTAQWIELDSGFPNAVFRKVFALNQNDVLVVGNSGFIMKSKNGGVIWHKKISGISDNLVDVQFPTQQTGYIIGTQNKLLKTTDSGENWVPITLQNINSVFGLSCVTADLILVYTDKGLIKSQNGGATWTNPIAVPISFSYMALMQFITEDIGFMGNAIPSFGGTNFIKTKNGGISWEAINAKTPFHFLNENIGFSYDSGFYKSSDGGNQFDLILYDGHPNLGNIFAVDDNTVWGLIDDRALNYDTSTQGIIKMSTTESGAYTKEIWYDNSFEVDMYSIHFANENCGYIVGKKYGQNKIWKNSNGSNTTLDSKEIESKYDIKIFPNPTSDKINIAVNSQFSKDFTITISDMSGKLVHNQNYNSAKEVVINTQSFAKGTYLFTIKSKRQSYSQKVIII